MNFYVGGGSASNLKMSITNAGNVGIGTSSPILKLHIKGTNSLPATSGTTQNGGIRIENGVNNGVLDIGASNATGAPGWLQATDKADLSQSYNLLLNPNGGNVGIGTTAPNAKLEVAGDITSTGLTVDYTGNRTGDAGILVTNDNSDWGIKVDKDGTTDYGILSQTDGENAIVVRNAAGVNKIQLQGDGDATFAGDVTVAGTFTAQEFRTELTTSTVLYDSGSTKFGDTSDDNHDFTGSLNVQGNVKHSGLTMTSGTDIDQLYTTTKSMTLTTNWQDTGINGTDLTTGTYVVAVYAHDYAVGGTHYYETYSGTMTWYHNDTNSTTSDEIILHKAGHHSSQNIYLRTKRTATADTDDLKLQIAHTATCTGNSDYVFKFRRLI
jgi:hypothetical protein